jgi:uncharacterized protein YprB with RNaseH-like and TPR domain
MDLRSKLGLYKESQGKMPPVQKRNTAREIDKLAPGSVLENCSGHCYIIENRYPLTYQYGGCCLGDALRIGREILPVLAGAGSEGLHAGQLLYLDTETTGLSGGAGTVAFLTGLGFFTQEEYVVRQYFLRDYDEEGAMLEELERLFSEYAGFVTFNGRAFDLNLLQGRFISNRRKPHFRDLPNADLLYPSRKIWGLKLESCRLSMLEENVLGETRQDDIPGAQIPAVYFKYVEDRDATDIKRVIRHNELDVLSMVALLVKLSNLLTNPLAEADGGYELLGLGRLFEITGKTGIMTECLEACMESEYSTVRLQAVKKLSGFYKKTGSYEKALEYWKAMETGETGMELFHLIEMAKYYEHKAKDISFALALTEKALHNCLSAGLSGTGQFEELRKRRERLLKKSRNPRYSQQPG